PSRTPAAPSRSAASVRAARRCSRAADSGPSPVLVTVTRTTSTGSRPRLRHCDAAASATWAEWACNPWSTTTAPAVPPSRGTTNAVAAARARESAPPEQATSTRRPVSPVAASARRTATRVAATSGAGPATSDSAVDPAHPRVRVRDLGRAGQRLGRLPHAVEALAADRVGDGPDELRPVAVLRHLGVHPEQPAQDLVDRSGALAALLELGADRGAGRDDRGADVVHDHVGVT